MGHFLLGKFSAKLLCLLTLEMKTKFMIFVICCLTISSESRRLSENEKRTVTGPPSLELYNKAKDHLSEVVTWYKTLPPSCVRLVFHDCVGSDGCDGCLNLNNPDNHGFEAVVEFLAYDRDTNFPEISHADYWQICAIASLEWGSDKLKARKIDFQGGRVDCSTAPQSDILWPFPDPIMNRKEMMEYFADPVTGFGFSEHEVITIMGAHGLGGAIRNQSGYEGAWTPGRDTLFNNELYQIMHEDIDKFYNGAVYPNGDFELYPGDRKYQWNYTVIGEPDPFGIETWASYILLNTDVELAYDIDVDNYGFGTKCELRKTAGENACRPIPKAQRLIKEYAYDEDYFLEEFLKAFKKMTTKTVHQLQKPQ